MRQLIPNPLKPLMVIVLLSLPPLHAQESAVSAISTERPTAGFSPDVIPRGSLQIESGANASVQRRQYVADLPESLFRLALTNRAEIRFLTSNALWSSSVPLGEKLLQTADTALSTKLLLAAPNRPLPKTAVLSLSFPTGMTGQTSGSYDPGLALIWTQASAHGYFLNEVFQSTLTTVLGARRPLWSPSIAGGKALSEAVTVFGEYAPNVLPDRSLTYTLDGGFAFTRGRLRQIDVRTGYTRDELGSHTLLSLGYSVRYDNLLHGPGRAHSAPAQ